MGRSRHLHLLLGVLSPLGLGIAGCGDDIADPTQTGSTGDVESTSGSTTVPDMDTTAALDDTGTEESTGAEVDPPEPLLWVDDCGYEGSDLSELHPDLLCTGIEVPLDWSDPESETIVVTAYKVPADPEVRRGQFWMLDGGPGGSGLGMLRDRERTDALREAGWDVLVPSHRGTLPKLQCDAVESTFDCRAQLDGQWGDDLRHFNTSQAAHDLAHLVERERPLPDDPVVVYGVSYGTMWGMHYGSLHPEQPDALVLDSLLPAEVEVLTQETEQQASVRDLLQRCIDDPDCGPTLPYQSGLEFAHAVVTAIDQGDCGAQDIGAWTDNDFRIDLGVLLNGSRRDYVPLMAALLATCSPKTTAIFSAAYSDLFSFQAPRSVEAPPSPWPRFGGAPSEGWEVHPSLFFSQALQFVVLGTTILRDGQDPTPYTDTAQVYMVGLGFDTLFHVTHEIWSSLPDVEPLPPFPADLPTLTLAGRYDQQTPLGWAEDTSAIVAGEHQSLLVFDTANHGVIDSGITADGGPCARDIVLAFAADPEAPLDTACMDDVPRVDPSLQRSDLQELSLEVFGTDDPWSLIP